MFCITEKYLQALRALNSAKAIDATSPEIHVRIADFRSRSESQTLIASTLEFVVHFKTHPSIVSALPTPLRDEVSATISSGLDSLAPGNPSLEALNSSFLQQGPTTAPKLLAAARVAIIAKQEPTVAEEYIFQLLNDAAHPTVSVCPLTLPLCVSLSLLSSDNSQISKDALSFLRDGFPSGPSSRADEFRAACDAKFPLSTIFKTDSELASIRKSHTYGIGEDRSDEAGKIEESD